MAIPRRSLHAGMVCAGWVFPIEGNTLEARVAPTGMIRGVVLKLPRVRDVTWKMVL